ncbi:hypothetical protein RBI14_17165 [Alcaligenaceae bacterium B3P038]|nr:hypothetical protein [Alcaligenaceae bacterium B3P038]
MVAPILVQTGYGERAGQVPRAQGLDKPLGTVVAGGAKHALIAGFPAKLRGTSSSAAMDEPLHTVSAGGQDQDAREPMHTIPTKDRLGLVTVAGEPYVIADIGMRML